MSKPEPLRKQKHSRAVVIGGYVLPWASVIGQCNCKIFKLQVTLP